MKIKFLLKKYLLQCQIALFLTLTFALLYVKYLINKVSNQINAQTKAIETQLMLQQDLKIELQQKMSIQNLKFLSQKYLPNHSYTASNRVVIKQNKQDAEG